MRYKHAAPLGLNAKTGKRGNGIVLIRVSIVGTTIVVPYAVTVPPRLWVVVIRSCYTYTAPLGLNAPMECFSCSTFNTTLRSAGVRGLASSRFYRHIARLERKTGESFTTATPQSRGLGFQARWVGKPNPYAFNFSPVRYKHAAPLGLSAKTGKRENGIVLIRIGIVGTTIVVPYSSFAVAVSPWLWGIWCIPCAINMSPRWG